jgi:hypothetical protein
MCADTFSDSVLVETGRVKHRKISVVYFSLSLDLVIRSRLACVNSNTVPLKICFLVFEAALLLDAHIHE